MNRVVIRKIALFLVMAVAVAACSGTDGQANDDPSETTLPAGDPIRVMMILDESEGEFDLLTSRAGAEARVERINADGGLGGSGRPLEIEYCKSELDQNIALECARTAAADESIVAVVGSLVLSDVTTVLGDAGLAYMPAVPNSIGDLTSTALVFNTNGGSVAGLAGQATLASQELGLTDIVNGRAGLESAVQGTAIIDLALESFGAAPTINAVDLPIGQADVSAVVAAMAEGAGAVVLSLLPEQMQQVVLSRSQQGIEVPFLGSTSNFTGESLEALGDAVEGMPLSAYYPTDDVDVPGNAAYLADLAAIDQLNQTGDITKGTWVSYDLLDYATQGLTEFDRDSVAAAVAAVTDYDAGELTPVLNFSAPVPNPLFAALPNLTFFHAVVVDGKMVSGGDGRFIDVFGTVS